MQTEKVILVVEDNPDDEALTVRALKKNHVANQIVVVRDGGDAVDFLFGLGAHSSRDATDLPQMVLLDLNLPKLSGLDVLRRIRNDARTRLLPVVILTASNKDEDAMRTHSLGVNGYVRKPVDFMELMSAVKTLGLHWLLLSGPTSKQPEAVSNAI